MTKATEPRDPAQRRADRQNLSELLVTLLASASHLRVDEAGWHVLEGKHGYIAKYSDRPDDILIYISCRSRRHWTYTKKRLSFCKVTQDGDSEGCLRLSRKPTPDEARQLRKALGLRQRTTFDPDALERKRSSMQRASTARGSAKTASPSQDIGKKNSGRPASRSR